MDASPSAGTGYEVPEPTATLVLDLPPYAGAEIEMRLGLSPLVYFGVRHWLSKLGPETNIEPAMEAVQELGRLFAEHGLDSWNLRYARGRRKGELIPATEDGVLGLDSRLVLLIASKWWEAVGTVALPLPDASAEAPSPSRPSETPPRSTPGGPDVASDPPPSMPTFPDSLPSEP